VNESKTNEKRKREKRRKEREERNGKINDIQIEKRWNRVYFKI
jgi:hypothetical protein